MTEPWAETDADGLDLVQALVCDATAAEGTCNVHEGAGYYAERIIKRAIKQGSLCLTLQGSAALPSEARSGIENRMRWYAKSGDFADRSILISDCRDAADYIATLEVRLRAATPTAPVQDDDAELVRRLREKALAAIDTALANAAPAQVESGK